MMKSQNIAIVLPISPLSDDIFCDIIEKLCCAFVPLSQMSFLLPKAGFHHYPDAVLDALNIKTLEEADEHSSAILVGDAPWPHHWSEALRNNALVIEPNLEVTTLVGRLAAEPFGHEMRASYFGDNSFHLGRLSALSPYGYTIGSQQFGPLDPFGFRRSPWPDLDPEQPQLRVAVLGGSGAFGSPHLTHHTVSHLLQECLNDTFEASSIDIRAHVRSYGKEGALLSDSFVDYLLHLSDESERPDVTIVLDGWNDLKAGESIPKDFVLENDYIFRIDRLDIPYTIRQQTTEFINRRKPDYSRPHRIDIAQAYVNKKEQFAKLVVNGGGFFIWAQQPFHNFRTSPPAKEVATVNKYKNRRLVALRERNIAFAYNASRERCQALQDSNIEFIDFIEEFNLIDPNLSCFTDAVHTNPQGNDVISRILAKRILDSSQSIPALQAIDPALFTEASERVGPQNVREMSVSERVAQISKIMPYTRMKNVCAQETGRHDKGDHVALIDSVVARLETQSSRNAAKEILVRIFDEDGAQKDKVRGGQRISPYLYTFY